MTLKGVRTASPDPTGRPGLRGGIRDAPSQGRAARPAGGPGLSPPPPRSAGQRRSPRHGGRGAGAPGLQEQQLSAFGGFPAPERRWAGQAGWRKRSRKQLSRAPEPALPRRALRAARRGRAAAGRPKHGAAGASGPLLPSLLPSLPRPAARGRPRGGDSFPRPPKHSSPPAGPHSCPPSPSAGPARRPRARRRGRPGDPTRPPRPRSGLLTLVAMALPVRAGLPVSPLRRGPRLLGRCVRPARRRWAAQAAPPQRPPVAAAAWGLLGGSAATPALGRRGLM